MLTLFLVFGFIGLYVALVAWSDWQAERRWYRESERIRRAYHDSEWEAAEFERQEPPASAPQEHPGIGEFVSIPYDVWKRYNHTM